MKNVLIIDDEPILCKILKLNLEKTGDYHADFANTVREGLEKIKSFRYDAAILDVLMPDMSGFEAVEQMRALPGDCGKIPVIVISGRPSMKELFHFASIYTFLNKPFEMKELLSVLGEACGVGSKQTEVQADASVSVQKMANPPKILVAAMERFMLGKISDYLQPLGCTVLTTSDENEAIAIALGQKPDYILYQYWEEPEKFNAAKLFIQTHQSPETQKIPCLVVCPKNLEIQASRELPKNKLVTYQDSRDLLTRLRMEIFT